MDFISGSGRLSLADLQSAISRARRAYGRAKLVASPRPGPLHMRARVCTDSRRDGVAGRSGSETYGDRDMHRRGGPDYMDSYHDARDTHGAAERHPGFRPDLAPTAVINALTNYVPRIRDLVHTVDTRRTGSITLHDFRRVLR